MIPNQKSRAQIKNWLCDFNVTLSAPMKKNSTKQNMACIFPSGGNVGVKVA
jgi:hypothetical protein